ncbi:CAP domain, partial [Trinorchestia longiramus]
ASNLYQITWNDELARIAKAWANQCQLASDCYDCRAPVTRPYYLTGQNVHQTVAVIPLVLPTGSNLLAKDWIAIIESWSSEVVNMNASLVSAFDPLSGSSSVGHYTQMLWASTSEIGCAQSIFGPCMEFVGTVPQLYDNCNLFVCNYGPAGNRVGSPVYSVGRTASGCRYGPSLQYPELC